MYQERKDIIRYSLDFNVSDINTYSGYRGDLVVKITTKEKDAVVAIRKYALSLGIKEVVIKQNKDLLLYEIYCITLDEAVYHIKTGDILDENHAKHSAKHPAKHTLDILVSE